MLGKAGREEWSVRRERVTSGESERERERESDSERAVLEKGEMT